VSHEPSLGFIARKISLKCQKRGDERIRIYLYHSYYNIIFLPFHNASLNLGKKLDMTFGLITYGGGGNEAYNAKKMDGCD